MAGDLTKRLCRLPERDGGLPYSDVSTNDPNYDPSTSHIATIDFQSSMRAVLGDYHTILQLKNKFNMTVGQQAEADVLVAKVNSGSPTLEQKRGRVDRISDILYTYDRRVDFPVTGYMTPDEVEARLLEIDQGYV